MSTKLVLIKARELIAKPENWHQGNWFNEEKPHCYCTLGAIAKALDNDIEDVDMLEWSACQVHDHTATKLILGIVNQRVKPYWGIADYNDAKERRHDEILSLFDEAIALAQD